LDIVKKVWAPPGKLCPPGVPSWLQADLNHMSNQTCNISKL